MPSESTRPVSGRNAATRAVQFLSLGLLASVWLAACSSGQRQPFSPSEWPAVPATPRLSSADNFRDVAGSDDPHAYRTADGQPLRRGIVYRSNALVLSAADKATIGGLGIATVFDLRTPGEIARNPDDVPPGASYLNINLFGTGDTPNPALTSPAASIALMENANRDFVADASARARLASLLRALAEGTGPQVYHCSAGKDRTGWVTAVLLSLVGVPRNVVVQDYLLTNTYSAASIQATYQRTADTYGPAFAEAYLPLLVVRESYLAAAFDQVAAQYGSMNGYLTHGLGLDIATQARLRARFVAGVAVVRQ